jgi:hypothetical protein
MDSIIGMHCFHYRYTTNSDEGGNLDLFCFYWESLFLNENNTVLTALARIVDAYHLVKLPARLVPFFIGKTRIIAFILAGCNFPTRSVVKEFLYPLNADFLFMD